MTLYQQWLGTASPRPNFYELLGLGDDEPTSPAVTEAAADARRRLTGQAPGEHLEQWQAILAEIDVAVRTLTDPTARGQYDRLVLTQGADAAAQEFSRRAQRGEMAVAPQSRAASPTTRPAAPAGLDPMAPIGKTARATAPSIAPAGYTPAAASSPTTARATTPAPTTATATATATPSARPTAPAVTSAGSAPPTGVASGPVVATGTAIPPVAPRVRVRPRRRSNPYAGAAMLVVSGGLLAALGVGVAYLYMTGLGERMIAQALGTDVEPPGAPSPTPAPPVAPEPPPTPVRPQGIENLAEMQNLAPPDQEPDMMTATNPATPPGGMAGPGGGMMSGMMNGSNNGGPGGDTMTAGPATPGPSAPGTMTPDAEMASAPTETGPPADPAEIAAVTERLRPVLAQIQQGDPEGAKSLLASIGDVANHPSQVARVEAMDAFADRMIAFWQAVEATTKRMGAMDEIRVGSSTVAAFVEATPEKLVVRVNGQNRTFAPFRQMPAGLAAELAKRFDNVLNPGDPMTPVTLGAIYAATKPPRLDEARERWQSGASRGADIDALMPVLDDIPILLADE